MSNKATVSCLFPMYCCCHSNATVPTSEDRKCHCPEFHLFMPGPLWLFLHVTVKEMTLSLTNIQLKRRKNLNWFYTDNPGILWCNAIHQSQAEPLRGDTAVLAPTIQIHICNLISKWCLSFFMQLLVSAGSPDRNCASPFSSPSQLSIFQPFMSISSSSLVKDELLTGMEHIPGVPGTALHSPNGEFYQQIQMTVRVTDKEIKEKQRDVADSRVNPSFTPHCCLPCRHI